MIRPPAIFFDPHLFPVGNFRNLCKQFLTDTSWFARVPQWAVGYRPEEGASSAARSYASTDQG